MTRRDFQALSAIRLREARHLVEKRCWDGAYYLGGYAVECALKACIAKQTERHTFPANRKRVEEVYSHDFPRLLKAAGLESILAQIETDQPELALNWQVVRNWSEQSRYERRTQSEAEELLRAIEDRNQGVLRWLKRHW
jgi:HEPN domain-containing protein